MMMMSIKSKVLNKIDLCGLGGIGSSWVMEGFNLPLLPKLPTCFPFMSVAPFLSTLAQIQHSAGLVSLRHHSSQQSAVNC